MVTLDPFLDGLGFVLAIDHCARNCLHCPAHGSAEPVERMPFGRLERILCELATRLPGPPVRTVHCWRISDPLDYWGRLPGRGGLVTCADVAGLWRVCLDQGLYVVTNGAEGRTPARSALAKFAASPDLVSQVKLTVTPFDRAWGADTYRADLADDIRQLHPLWDLPSTRPEDAAGRRFRINAKTTPERDAETRDLLADVLARAGLSKTQVSEAITDPTRVVIKPVYDLGSATGDSPVNGAVSLRTATGQRYKPTSPVRARWQYGIRPNLRLFKVDMYAFTEHDLTGPSGTPLTWPPQPFPVQSAPAL